MIDFERVVTDVVDCGFRLHKEIGPGLLESAYEALLAHLLMERGHHVSRQQLVPISFAGHFVDQGFRADLIVAQAVLVELKSVERLAPVHGKQVLTYLRFLDMPIGILMNFGAPTFKEGLKRIINPQAKY